MKDLIPLIAALVLSSFASLTAAEKSQPNIVYILADDMGYADAGFNGGTEIKTPNLDGLARDGAILKSFYAQPLCSPSRAALLSGRYPSHTGVFGIVAPHAKWGLPLEERTLAQAMGEAGYETAIVGKWHIGESQPAYLPTQRGFDHQYGHWLGLVDYYTHKRFPDDKTTDWHRDDQPCADEGYTTHLLAREACRLIKEKNPDKPLFLYLPFNAVHSPWEAPDSYLQPYGKLEGDRRIYAGMLAAMDEAIGQVLAALDEKGMRKNTLIVFSSDNGGPKPDVITSNLPLRAGKRTIYEGGVRVVAFANWPGHIPAGAVIDEPLHNVDWYPTLVKLGGGSLDQKLPLDGRDIWPVLTQGANSPHEAVLLYGTTPGIAAIRMGDWKLLLWIRGDKNKDKVELYNLANDLAEKKDLAAAMPEKVQALRALLDAAMKAAVPPGNSGLVPDKAEE